MCKSTGNMHCQRCNNLVTLESITNEMVPMAGYNIESLHCPTCSSCITLRVDGVKKTLEEVLENESRNDGWHPVLNDAELLSHYVLSQIIYRRSEGPRRERNECEFDLPDPDDDIRILWKDNMAIGFYTLKLKGTFIEGRQESYEMVTLDTAYIRSDCRGQGLGFSILEDINKNHGGEDIAFSSPIAIPMLKVIDKFIYEHPEMKYKLWEVTGGGCEGSKKLVWFAVNRNRKSSLAKVGPRGFGRVGPCL